MILGKNIYLKPISDKDTEQIVYWRNKDFVKINCICQDEFTREKHEKWMRTKVDTGEVVQFVIYTHTHKSIGTVYLKDIDRVNLKAELGIHIGEEGYLGKGMGSEATALILKYAFNEMNLHKVFLRVFANNRRAMKCYQNTGFIEESYLKNDVCIAGQYYDVVYMSVIKDVFS